MSTILEVQNVSKQYRLGTVGTGTLSHDLNRWWYKVRGKDNPYLKIGSANDRSAKADSDYVWALQDISFNVKKGEVLGIIGKNGAGKSTLLKILSRVTGPTTGSIKAYGRIASLLEVGTGFQPELTGRENIFLNGAILGMSKSEIKSKLDEIIDFSGCERYIDTPVKRYSSGMYVRLAFAVAAHLEPEILIVDEVLAVGDAEFQQKALGKMKDISTGQGRTVLFVSHNIAAITQLCDVGLLIDKGRTALYGPIEDVVNKYIDVVKNTTFTNNLSVITKRDGLGTLRFKRYIMRDDKMNICSNAVSGSGLSIEFEMENCSETDIQSFHISVQFVTNDGICLSHCSNTISNGKDYYIKNTTRNFKVSCSIEQLPLPAGEYFINIYCSNFYSVLDSIEHGIKLTVFEGDFFGSGKVPQNSLGLFYLKNQWDFS